MVKCIYNIDIIPLNVDIPLPLTSILSQKPLLYLRSSYISQSKPCSLCLLNIIYCAIHNLQVYIVNKVSAQTVLVYFILLTSEHTSLPHQYTEHQRCKHMKQFRTQATFLPYLHTRSSARTSLHRSVNTASGKSVFRACVIRASLPNILKFLSVPTEPNTLQNSSHIILTIVPSSIITLYNEPTNAQLIYKLLYCSYMFWHCCFILR
jgi:hypothetical protein